MSSMSLITSIRYSPDFFDRSRWIAAAGGSSRERRASSFDPTMALSGVRMSCDILVRKSLLRLARALSSFVLWFLLAR